jgi:hypothetical protein
MPAIDIDFHWTRALRGYRAELEPAGSTILTSSVPARVIIAPVDDQTCAVDPLNIGNLYLVFAQLSGEAGACVTFACSWGLLSRPRPGIRGEPFDFWRREIESLRTAVELAADDPTRVCQYVPPDPMAPFPPRLDVWLVSRGGPRATSLMLRPTSLIDALWLQFFAALAGDREIKACERCGLWFERGASSERGRKARFCTDKCRMDFHNEQRKGTAQ